MAETLDYDDHLATDGRVMEILSEHTCQGWLEGYLLTGRHGLFSCYEAFVHIVDSMFNQHAKWLKVCHEIPWRADIASLNILLTSHVWRQDHNGFSHQDPGFINHVINKKVDIVRVYLPPDANTLLCATHECLNSRNLVNVIVAGKQPEPQWLDMDAAIRHCSTGIGIWEWASNDQDGRPDVIMACCGDVPTIETLAAVDLLHHYAPGLKIRVVNVIDLMTLQPRDEHPHGLPDDNFDALFGTDIPVIFAFHGYPWLIHRLTYRRKFHGYLHVRGYKEEGTTTTPFDMVVRNDLDRFHLVMDAASRVPGLRDRAGHIHQTMQDRLVDHRQYITEHGEDMPEIRDWKWPARPVENEELSTLYRALIERGNVSLEEALHVGGYIEELDIGDLEEAIAESSHADVVQAYENLERGSRNHLRAFVGQIENLGIVYEAQLMSQEEVDAIVNSATERGGKGRGKRRGGR